ncbi:MAG: acetate uptake transporter [Methanospirillum sp.]
MVVYLVLWGLFTLILFIGAPKMTRALQVVLGTLALVCFLEAVGAATGAGTFMILAGHVGIVSSLAAIYTAPAPFLNDLYETTVAPLG